jgi:inorganic pyrophosphatase
VSERVEVTVEVPKGSRNKYTRMPDGAMRLDRVLYSSVHYPADYGIVEGTRDEDGGPLDALVLITEATFAGCHVPARVIGVLDTRDSRGVDHKLLCVPAGDPHFENVQDIVDVEPNWLREIETFFSTYKTLEGEDVDVVAWGNAETASAILQAAWAAGRAPTTELLP